MAMLFQHQGLTPTVDPTAYVAPNATLSGDVRVGPGCRVLFGAVLTAEGGPVELGEGCIVMENAVLRGTRRDPVRLGRHVLVGPGAYLVGCDAADDVFLAAGCRVFNGARVGARSEVRINAVVHLRTVLAEGTTVPIGWVAVGDPGQLFPPDDHGEIWAVQRELDFPGYVFGLARPADGESLMPEISRRYGRALGRHRDDRRVDDGRPGGEPDGISR
ncbi:gamma carbonic anhydrase family protein [Streptomyces sp. NPDC006368]|uniref:gamma carbonic anhydrase family protein n=1 Tax=Streptomyces sp. NPDC006368 TaxID=3156760 RepID=UPI0033A50A62